MTPTNPHSQTDVTKSRLHGAVYGALVGDALGVPVEFTSRDQRRADPVSDMRAFGTWDQPAGTWSDDGALTLCSLEGLIAATPEHPERQRQPGTNHLGKLFVDWMQNARWTARDSVFDIGNATHAALSRILTGVSAERAGGADEMDSGNGSLMRILPVALRFFDSVTPAELADYAMRASAITHAHIRSRLACACLCLIAQQMLKRSATDATEKDNHTFAREAVCKGVENFLPILAAHPNERIHFARIVSCDLDLAGSDSIRSGGYVMDTLEAAIWCLLNHDTFADTVLAAVNLGGDTDTTGCVTGGLAGLLYGYNAIPTKWIAALPKRAEVDALLHNFISSNAHPN